MFRQAVPITSLFFSSGLASDQPPLRPKIYGAAFVRTKSSDFHADQLHKNGLALDSKFADEKPEIGRDGKWQYDIYDPDLTRIELMEPAPAKDPSLHRCASQTMNSFLPSGETPIQ